MGCPQVVHYWADLQSMHGFHYCDNIVPNTKCQRVLVLTLCLVSYINALIVHANLLALLWPPYGIGQAIIFLPCGFFLLLSFFFSSSNLSGRRLDVYHTSTHGVALKPNSITLAGSELVRSWFRAGSELVRSWFKPDSVMEFGFQPASSQL